MYDPFAIIFKSVVLVAFGPGLILSVVFTFAIETFLEWYQKFEDVDLLSHRIINPFHRNIHLVEEWLIVNHGVSGFLCVMCSLWEIISLFALSETF
jgi:hypothetical protein